MEQTQGFGMPMIIGIVAVVALAAGVLFVQNQNTNKAEMEAKMMDEKMKMEEAAMMEKKAMDEKAMMETDKAMMDKGGETMEKTDDAMMEKKGEMMEGEETM